MDHACGTCRFFEPQPPARPERDPRRGLCTHPAHQSRGVTILVYSQEMRCRRGFGEDDWSPPGGPSADRPLTTTRGLGDPPADILIDERPAPMNRPRRAFPVFAPLPVYAGRDDVAAD